MSLRAARLRSNPQLTREIAYHFVPFLGIMAHIVGKERLLAMT
jgi:hypothetical protein